MDKNQLFVGLTETWLHNHKPAETEIENFTLYQANRPKSNKQGRHGGGAAIYLCNDLAASANEILVYSSEGTETIAVSIEW